ncbi:MAG: putative ATP/GTP-binding protein (mrp protein homolog), partial [uncultured Solirubrobacteraceae bacterium]
VPDDPGLPDQEPLPDRGGAGRPRRGGNQPRERRLRRPVGFREGRPAEAARPQRTSRGRPRQGQERHLRRLRQGRSRQVVADRQPRRRPGDGRQEGRRPR